MEHQKIQIQNSQGLRDKPTKDSHPQHEQNEIETENLGGKTGDNVEGECEVQKGLGSSLEDTGINQTPQN